MKIGHFLWSIVHGVLIRFGWSTRVLAVTPDFYVLAQKRAGVPEPRVVRCHAIVRGPALQLGCGDVVFAYRVAADRDPGGGNIEALRYVDRGVTWCYGWREEDAKILHALTALDRSR